MQNRSRSKSISYESTSHNDKRLRLDDSDSEESRDQVYENSESSSHDSLQLSNEEFDLENDQTSILSFSRPLSPTRQMLNSILQNPDYLKQLTNAIQSKEQNKEVFDKSVVKIECNSKGFSYDTPWQAASEESSSGSGFILNHSGYIFIISNAHVVSDHSNVTVRLSDESNCYHANVELIDHDCDLSILSVSDPYFIKMVKPFELGEMTSMRESITVLGFPIGGNELCITEGKVSRIEVRSYCESGLDFLQIQISAAINPGNSGGAVLDNSNKVIGVAFQGNSSGAGLGYIIPSPIVKHFLDDYIRNTASSRQYHGFPDIKIKYQKLQNPEHRKILKLEDHELGVRIIHVAQLCSSFNILMIDDILIELDGYPIQFDGTVQTDFSKRIDLSYLISSKHIGDTLEAKVLRNNQEIKLAIPLRFRANTTDLVANVEHEKPPTYYIFCATVFVPVSADNIDDANLYDDNTEEYHNKDKKFPGQELVMIKNMFECEYTKHQSHCADNLVATVNKEKVKNLRHLIHLIESCIEEHVILTTNTKLTCVLKRLTEEKHKDILGGFGINSDRSTDLLSPPVYKPGSPEYEEQLASSERLRPTEFLL